WGGRRGGRGWVLGNPPGQGDARGGGPPRVTGFHPPIDRPDSVSRVAPPTTTAANIRAATASSHSRTARRRVSADGARLVMGSFVCRQRGCKVATRLQRARKGPSIPTTTRDA